MNQYELRVNEGCEIGPLPRASGNIVNFQKILNGRSMLECIQSEQVQVPSARCRCMVILSPQTHSRTHTNTRALRADAGAAHGQHTGSTRAAQTRVSQGERGVVG
jgi:hypothetical protein